MKSHIYQVEPNPDYDRNITENKNHQYLVNFLLDSMIPWYKTRDRPGTFNSEKVRCEQVLSHIKSLLRRITTKPSHQLKERVVIDIMRIQKSMISQVPLFSDKTREYCLRQIEEHLGAYR